MDCDIPGKGPGGMITFSPECHTLSRQLTGAYYPIAPVRCQAFLAIPLSCNILHFPALRMSGPHLSVKLTGLLGITGLKLTCSVSRPCDFFTKRSRATPATSDDVSSSPRTLSSSSLEGERARPAPPHFIQYIYHCNCIN